jgi:hypothetical protein
MLRTLGDSLAGSMEFKSKDGKTYQIHRLTLRDMSLFEGWLEGRARESLRQMLDVVPPEIFGDLARDMVDKIQKGHYAFGGPAANNAMRTVPGLVKLVSIACRIPEAEAIHLMENDQDSLMEAVKMMVDRSMPEGDGDQEGNQVRT